MILIGSQALNYYIPLQRKLHDWDLIASKEQLEVFHKTYGQYLVKSTDYSYIYDIRGEIVEIRNPETLDSTDRQLIHMWADFPCLGTKYGNLYIPNIQILFDIKMATAGVIKEPKHQYDADVIFNNFKVLTCSDFYFQRLKETETRYLTSGKKLHDFFHKYHIPEYILHDRLHEMISDLLEISLPTYKRITTAETDISEELFNKLTHEQKISLMMEESLVLNLERWFIPQNVENGINYRLIDKFYNNNEAMPTYKILKHVNLTGLKGEAKYITDFGKANFFEIELAWIAAKEKIKGKGGFPMWFFQELFDLREKYKKGEEIGFHLAKSGAV